MCEILVTEEKNVINTWLETREPTPASPTFQAIFLSGSI